MARLNHTTNLVGGYREGGGRPKGSKNKVSEESVKRLEALGFDPIAESVELYNSTKVRLTALEAQGKDNETTTKLRNLLSRINADLLGYNYKKLPTMSQIEQTVEEKGKPIAIRLTLGDKDE
jgi:hypothetical protein